MTQVHDAGSTAGKKLVLRDSVQQLVVGAGPAGCAAALEAARRGLTVMLVDEHPVDAASMGLDVPFHFGQRMNGAVRNKGQMTERIVEANPRIGEAFEAGVDVRLGVAAWGLFTPRPGTLWIGASAVGLTDGEQSWFCGFDAAIIATGRRDAGLAFPGWTLPGVMGVTAADHLLRRYEALDGQSFAILGSGAEATLFAEAAVAAGRRVVAIVEVADEPLDRTGCEKLAAGGTHILTGSMIKGASGRDGIEAIRVVRRSEEDAGTEIACDTIVLATGAVPVIDLLDVAGAAIAFVPERGGHVPLLGPAGQTSVAMVYAVGDCTGIDEVRTRDPAIAADEGVRAATAAAMAIAEGAAVAWPTPALPAPAAGGVDAAAQRLAWARESLAVAEADTLVCQCEEVSLHDLLGVRPPRYLGRGQPALAARDLVSLAAEGRLNQDQVKRLTRAGMGACQGRRCREQIGAVMACATGAPLASIPLPTYRAPVRPLPLSAFGETEETQEIANNWVGWFGIEGQWIPFWEPVPDQAETEDRP